METTIAHRFGKLIEALNITTNAFANSLGKPYSSIKVIVDGSSKPGYELLETVFATYPKVSRDWLLMGEGEMFREKAPIERGDGYLMKYIKELEERVNEQSMTIRALLQELGKPEVVLALAASCALFFMFWVQLWVQPISR